MSTILNQNRILEFLNSNFTVENIMIPVEKLMKGFSQQECLNLLSSQSQFDTIPLIQKESIKGYYMRDSEFFNKLEIEELVSSSTGIFELLDILQKRKFCFVFKGNITVGFVEYADLNQQIVKIPFYVLLQTLEGLILDQIRPLTERDILSLPDQERARKIIESYVQQRYADVDVDFANNLYFDEIVNFGINKGVLSIKPKMVRLMADYRNRVSHADKLLVKTRSEINSLIKIKEACMTSITELTEIPK
jgi:hypothetical protein